MIRASRVLLSVVVAALTALTGLILSASLIGCAQPEPIVTLATPGPLPADRFAGLVSDCHALTSEERRAAEVSVRCCLAQDDLAACLATRTQHADASLMCALRDVGASLVVSVARGEADQATRDRAEAVQRFIRDRNLGFK